MAGAAEQRGRRAVDRIARQYRSLGYRVEREPESASLPGFLQDLAPDLVARSAFDNVVVEVKPSRALKGDNELVEIADRISTHPDWRFELVALDEQASKSGADPIPLGKLKERARLAARHGASDAGYVFATAVLVEIAQQLAEQRKIRSAVGAELFHALGFRGVISEEMVDGCLEALQLRNELVHALRPPAVPASAFQKLLRLCDDLYSFTEFPAARSEPVPPA